MKTIEVRATGALRHLAFVILVVSLSFSNIACQKSANEPAPSSENKKRTTKAPALPPLPTGPGVHCRLRGQPWVSKQNTAVLSGDQGKQISLVFESEPIATGEQEKFSLVYDVETKELVSVQVVAQRKKATGELMEVHIECDNAKAKPNGLNWAKGKLVSIEDSKVAGEFQCVLMIGRQYLKHLDDSVSGEFRIECNFADIEYQ